MKHICVLGKMKKILSKQQATSEASKIANWKVSGQKVTKTHILYGFGGTFFEPTYVTDDELKSIASIFRQVYALHQGTQY